MKEMNWYIVDLLFARKPEDELSYVKCESCNVLFEAESAISAHKKSTEWAKEHIEETDFHFVGVMNVRKLLDGRPGDGSEVGGSFFDEWNVWGRKQEIIPDMNEIAEIKFESHPNTPIRDLISDEKKKEVRDFFEGEE